jgi:hypothetical protein
MRAQVEVVATEVGEIHGVSRVSVLTSETVWSLTHLSQRLAVLGGGTGGDLRQSSPMAWRS